MRVADNWKDYELIDCSCGERLERWGNITLIRPDPQVIWKTEKKNPITPYIPPRLNTATMKRRAAYIR